MSKALITIGCILALMVPIVAATAADDAKPAEPPKPAARPARPQPAARDPNTPGFVKAKELEDGAVPSADEDGNFIIGPTHKKASEMTVKEGTPRGTIHNLTMKS